MRTNPSIKKNTKSEINSLSSAYEKEYLSAMLKKREGNFEEAFNQLLPLLKDPPKQFNYYEEISSLGKITGNLDKLSEWIIEHGDTSDYFNLYFRSLIDKEKGHTSNSISTYEYLINKGFASKEIYYQLAYALRTIGNYKDAFNNLTEAEKICAKEDPFLEKIINLKGTLFFLSGRL